MILICSTVFSQQVKRNLEIFDELISKQVEKIIFTTGLNKEKEFSFFVKSDEESFVKNIIKKTCGNNKIKHSFSEIQSTDSNFYLILLTVNSLRTTYPGFKSKNFLGEKIIFRNLKGNVSFEISESGKNLARSSEEINFKDAVNMENVEQIESEEYKFTKGKLPSVGLIEELFFPALLVVASAVATVLFFTIRTK